MGLFDTLFNSATGQSEMPPSPVFPELNYPTLGAALRKLNRETTPLANINAGFNAALAPQLMDTQLGVERQYDPGIAALRNLTTQAVTDKLERGGTIPPDVMANLLQAGFERNSLTGLGGSGAGRGVVARDIGLTTLDLINEAIRNAGDWTRSSPLPGQLYQPTVDVTPGTGMQYNIDRTNTENSWNAARANAQNAFNQLMVQTRNQNTANMIDRPLGIVSTLAGIYGSLNGGGASPINGMKYPSSYEYGLNNPSQYTPYAPVATPSSYGIQLRGTPSLR